MHRTYSHITYYKRTINVPVTSFRDGLSTCVLTHARTRVCTLRTFFRHERARSGKTDRIRTRKSPWRACRTTEQCRLFSHCEIYSRNPLPALPSSRNGCCRVIRFREFFLRTAFCRHWQSPAPQSLLDPLVLISQSLYLPTFSNQYWFWRNVAVLASSFSPTRQKGQSSRLIGRSGIFYNYCTAPIERPMVSYFVN